NLPAGVTPELGSPYYVGRMRTFALDTGGHAGHGGAGHTMPSYQFAVGEVLTRQLRVGQWQGGPVRVTITTLGAAESAGTTYMTIGRVSLR
ncbi:MAG: tyrosinase, partial [Alphaproteobacteria bacterium]|nr:tyrosinase [Alphaproteobacteria bacterium]